MNTYKFDEHTTEEMKDGITIALRKSGFSAWRDEDLHTDATYGQAILVAGQGWMLHMN